MFDKNLKDYKRDIPQLFWYNLFVCVSNGIQTRVGSFNAPWDHFFSWLKLTDTAITHDQPTKEEIEEESERTGEHLSLKIFGEGLCSKENLLDYFENFVLYHKNKVKIIAKNHQYLGVNNAILALQNKETNKGKLGIFWHTQGSGKSYSMIFIVSKYLVPKGYRGLTVFPFVFLKKNYKMLLKVKFIVLFLDFVSFGI